MVCTVVFMFNLLVIVNCYHRINYKKSSCTYINEITFRHKHVHFISDKYKIIKCNSKVIELNEDSNGEVSDNKYKDDIVNVLSNILDPDDGIDIIEANMIQNIEIKDNNISLDIVVKQSKLVIATDIKKLCLFQLSMIEWVNDINVNIVNLDSIDSNVKNNMVNENGLSKIKHIIAVSSCKGGVGKSTVSVNLAYTLSKKGYKVGILDADIYGPSLPTMTKPILGGKLYVDNKLIPLEYEGVKLLSLGFINQGAAIMRGPMVNQILNQFVLMSDWKDLDYLVIDMPPGTGDIQLTLSQIMNITAAVIVTTPQKLSFVDVVKGIDMFDTVNIPCIAVVENMADYNTYSFNEDFYCSLSNKISSYMNINTDSSNNNKAKPTTKITTVLSSSISSLESIESFKDLSMLLKHEIELQKQPQRVFGNGHTQRLKEMWGIENIISLPIVNEISTSGDNGIPYILSYPNSIVATNMNQLTNDLVQEVDKLMNNNKSNPILHYDSITNNLDYNSYILKPYALRCDCRCAVCVEEMTGKSLLNKELVPTTIKPLGMAPIGKYAVSVDWSDGHKSLYPHRQINKLIQSL